MKKMMLFWMVVAGLMFLAGEGRADTAAGIVTMDFDLSEHDKNKEVDLWVPYPVSSKVQDISGVQVSGDFAESAVYTDKKYQTPILYARWEKGAPSRRLQMTFKAIRQEVVRRDLPTEGAAWNKEDFSQWLAPTSLGPVDGVVGELAAKITKGKNTTLEKAKAIYDWICENMHRNPKTIGCGKGDVCLLLQTPGGKCTDIHSVFVALSRAAGVPAREIFGVRLGKNDVQDISNWQHCWAEFYLPGYGWVPVDPADVLKMMLKKNLTLESPETAELRRYFWGAWDAYRVELARGRDLVLSPPQKGAPLNTFGYPYAEVGGKHLDFYDTASFKYTFTTYKVAADGYGLIDTGGLKSMLDRSYKVAIFDARDPVEYREMHVSGAKNLPQKKFETNAHLLPEDKSQLLVFYCDGVQCGQSKQAARKAIALGYKNVLVYDEGMPVWKEKGMPVFTGRNDKGNGETTKVKPVGLNNLGVSNEGVYQDVDNPGLEGFTQQHIPGAASPLLAAIAA
ncbi:MAG: transglutaminase domain-containing protein, partial [Desulfobulbales bacterium]|nr:transglutaminase domain-containing protein [Desulfobulbales bacterium]